MAKDTIKKKAQEGILAEDINSKLGLILEGHSVLIKRFDGMDKRFDKVDKKFNEIDKRFEAIDKRFDEVDKRFEAIDKRFDEVDSKFETVFNYLSATEPQDGKIENLDKRVIILEKQSVTSK